MKFKKLLPVLLSFIMMFVLAAPKSVQAAGEGPTNVTIHKLQMPENPNINPISADGTEKSLTDIGAALNTTVTPLPGVVFEYWTITDGASFANLNQITDISVLNTLYTHQVLAATSNPDGTVSIPSMPNGRYYFREIVTPANVHRGIGVPFMLELPLMNAAGTAYITDLHIYPKNTTVYGAVTLTKVAGYGELLSGAKFRLYTGIPANPFVPASPGIEYIPEGGAATEYVTDSNGKINIVNLPYGHYYFVETQSPDRFMLNPAPVEFFIQDNSTVLVSKTNWLFPKIDKYITSLGTTSDSASFNENVTWKFKVLLPGNVSSYSKFIIRDVLSDKLNYIGNLTVTVGTATLVEGTHYNLVTPTGTSGGTLEIQFIPTSLGIPPFTDDDLINNTTITFTTKINGNAIMGQAIPNNATILYNDNISGEGNITSGYANAYTGGKVFKKVADAENGAPLSGAQFKVATDSSGSNFLKDAFGNDVILTSGQDGLFEIKGLKYDLVNGTNYYLIETVAPIGYNLSTSAIPFTVMKASYYANPSVITSGSTSATAIPSLIVNKTGAQIPQTGGMGTILFTVIGLGVMATAVVLNRRKRNNLN